MVKILKYILPAALMILAVAGTFQTLSAGKQSAGQDSARIRQADKLARGLTLSSPEDIRQALHEFTREPHPLGSARQKRLARWLLTRLKKSGLSASLQEFSAETPAYPGAGGHLRVKGRPGRLRQPGYNVTARIPRPEASCDILLASHYDTKRIKGIAYVGANDGASSSVALLFLAEYLFKNQKHIPSGACQMNFVWFDGEESVLPGWNDGLALPGFRERDNTYGSRHYAGLLTPCQGKKLCLPDHPAGPLSGLILMDMTGDPEIRLTRDRNSDPDLVARALKAGRRFLGRDISGSWQEVEDDHIPFVKAGIPAINLINFEKLQHWHQPGDLPHTISTNSMKSFARIALFLALTLPAS